MTFAAGDVCTPAAIFPYVAAGDAAENLANGIVVNQPLLGVVSDEAAVDVEWNNGRIVTAISGDSLRFVGAAATATVNQFLGKMVRVGSASQEFTGLCASVFALEAATVGKANDLDVVTTEVVLFRTKAGQFILAAATAVAVAVGQ